MKPVFAKVDELSILYFRLLYRLGSSGVVLISVTLGNHVPLAIIRQARMNWTQTRRLPDIIGSIDWRAAHTAIKMAIMTLAPLIPTNKFLIDIIFN